MGIFYIIVFSLADTTHCPASLSQCGPSVTQVKSSHIYLYTAFHNTDCIKAASQ